MARRIKLGQPISTYTGAGSSRAEKLHSRICCAITITLAFALLILIGLFVLNRVSPSSFSPERVKFGAVLF